MNILWIIKYSIYFHELLSLNKFDRIRCLFCSNFKDEDSDLKKKFKSTWYENQKETNLNEDWVFLTPKFKKMDKLSESVCLLLYIMIYICRYSLYPPPLSRIMRINTVYKSFAWKLYPQARTTYSLGLDILPLKLFTHWEFVSSFSSRKHADVSLWCYLWNFGLIQEEQFSFDTQFFFWVRFHIA